MAVIIRPRCVWCGVFLPLKHNELIHNGRVIPFCLREDCQDAKQEMIDQANQIIEINRPVQKKSEVLTWAEVSQCPLCLN